jgi:type IV secretion system protein VirB4
MIEAHPTTKKQQSINQEVASLVPIACHYNQYTLLTKNGELVQTIRINGLVDAKHIAIQNSLRNVIRSALQDMFHNKNLAIYLHVMRDRTGVSTSPNFDSSFAFSIDKQWRLFNNFDNELANTLYITIIHSGLKQTSALQNVAQAMFFNLFSSQSFRFLDSCHEMLTSFTNELANKLAIYKAEVLNIIQNEDEQYISEPLSFYFKLLHLQNIQVPLEKYGAAEQISNIEIQYNVDSMLIQDYGHPERKAVVFTIKYPYNLEQVVSDQILQLPQEFILTETIMIADEQQATKDFKEHLRTYRASHNENLISDFNIDKLLHRSEKKVGDYCKQQIILTLYGSDEILLKYSIEHLNEVFKNCGIAGIREDVNMATTYFAQMPGNFNCLTREVYNATKYAANFSLIHYQKMGSLHGSRWGEPISVIRSIEEAPYYFNFHDRENGNTFLYGSDQLETSALLRFFLAQATRLKPKMLLFNINKDRKDLIESFDEDLCQKIILNIKEDSPIKMDLFDIKNNFQGKPELFIGTLVVDILHSENPKEDAIKLAELLQEITSENSAEKRQKMITKLIADNKQTHSQIVKKLLEFLESDIYQNFFSENKIPNVLKKRIAIIDVSDVYTEFPEVCFVIGNVLMKLPPMLQQDDKVLISLNNSEFLFSLELFGSQLGNWLRNLTKKNAIAVLALFNKKLLESEIWLNARNEFGTKVLLSDRLANKRLQAALDLNDNEFLKFKSYDRSHHAFLVKQTTDSVFCAFDLTKIPELKKMLG